jgi:pimeloyl-ACP methyl ester carboxylesterase
MSAGHGQARVGTPVGGPASAEYLGPQYVDLDDCSISFSQNRREGATTLVFLHGIGCSKAVWAPVLERLPQSWRLIAYDLRGAGQSKESVEHSLCLERWASDLKVLLEHWQVGGRPVVVGHSLGASIALEFALDYGDLPGALVLLGAEAGLCRLGPLMQERAKAIEETGLHGFVTGPWRKAPPFSAASRAAYPTMVDGYAEMLYETGAERYIRAVAAIAESPDLTGRLSEITLPSLVLIGGEDDRTLPEFGRELASKLPNGKAVELPAVGHTLSLEAPERVAEEIGSFVQKTGLG